MTERDVQRQRTYDAEVAALGGTWIDEALSPADLTAVFEAAVRHRWWRMLSVPAPLLAAGRAGSARSSSDGVTVRISPSDRTGATLAHELAHHLVTHLGLAGPAHGAHFRAAALRTVELVGGATPRRLLHEEWRRWRLTVAAWDHPEPSEPVGVLGPPTPEPDGVRLRGAIAL
ncbi:MAG: hypothetical protein ACXIVQ_00190 [Acidimicrobiales bacterium]